MTRQGSKRLATIVMAIFWLVLSGASAKAAVFFEDNFDGTGIDTTLWNGDNATSNLRFCPTSTQAHHTYGVWQDVSQFACWGSKQAAPYGGLTVQNGAASFSAGFSRTFPYIWAGPPSRWAPFPEDGDFSLEVRMQYSAIWGNGDGVAVLHADNSDPVGSNPSIPQGQYIFGIWADWGGVRSGGGSIARYSPAASAWHTYRLDYVDGAYSTYLDGVLNWGPVADARRPNVLWLGNPVYTGWGYGDWSDFAIDYIRVTVPEPVCTEPPAGIVGWWPADGNTAAMVAGSAGALQSRTSFAEGQVGQAFSFDGIGGTINVPQTASLNVGGQVTIDFWMKAAPDNGANSCCQGLVTTDFYGIEISGGKDAQAGVNFFVNTGDSFSHTSDANNGGAVVTPGEWHHIAGTYDGSALQLYVDGRPWGNPTPCTGTIPPMSAEGFLSIGSEEGRLNEPWIAQTRYFNGLIDEVEIHNRALTAAEIRDIYHAESAGKCRENYVPTANAGEDQSVEATSCAGASLSLDGSASTDLDNDALTYTWIENGSLIATGINPTITFSYGTHVIALTVDDGKGGTSSDDVVVNVVDTTAPELGGELSPKVLWPPDHRYVTVTPSITVADACVDTTQVALVSAMSNEPDNGNGDGNTTNDIIVNADGSLSLRAERAGTGSGRIYTVTYTATDIAGNVTTATATVTVPHDKSCGRNDSACNQK